MRSVALAIPLILVSPLSFVLAQTTFADDDAALAIFNQRILPIFQATHPSSCTECHLSGLDLKDFIDASQEKTFASLVSRGLVDVAHPDKSKILDFIRRRPKQPNLITDKVRQQEYEAFHAWILAAAKDAKLRSLKDVKDPVGPRLPDEVIRHARRDRVLASFIENIWNEIGRCAACHSPEQNQKQVLEHGDTVSWITPGDPETTMSHLVESHLIDPEAPEKSLILAKPTMQVEHGGGQKMVVGDRSFKQFRSFVDDYAAVVHGKYMSADQLPKPNDELCVMTDIWLKLSGVPERFDEMLLQVDLYRWEEDRWSPDRWATSDRLVFGKGKLWQHSLALTAPQGSQRTKDVQAKRLPPGRYLVKIYVDQQGRLQKDFRAVLGERDLVGQVEIESRWPPGYSEMTIVGFPIRVQK